MNPVNVTPGRLGEGLALATALLALAIGAGGGVVSVLSSLTDPAVSAGERVLLLVVWSLVLAPLIMVTLWPFTVPLVAAGAAAAVYLRARRGRSWPTSLRVVVYGYLLLIGLALLTL